MTREPDLDPEQNRRFAHYKVRPGVWDQFRKSLLSRKLPGVMAQDSQGRVGRIDVRRLHLSDERSSVRASDLVRFVTETPGLGAHRIMCDGRFDYVIVGNRKEVQAWINRVVVESVMDES